MQNILGSGKYYWLWKATNKFMFEFVCIYIYISMLSIYIKLYLFYILIIPMFYLQMYHTWPEKTIVNWCDHVLGKGYSVTKMKGKGKQANGHDCGVFVARWM